LAIASYPLSSRLRAVLVVIAFRLGRLLAVLGFVLSGELGFLLWMANEALGLGAVVLLAPIAFGLEIGDQLGVAAGTDFFRNAVLVAPPAFMFVAGFRNVRMGRGCRMSTADKGASGDGT
jgi:hypothetical protein